MAVRKSETRLPAGYAAQDLGQAGKLVYWGTDVPKAAPDCHLVSYLPSPIRVHANNTYVVLVTDPELAKKVDHHLWILKANWFPGGQVAITTDIGILRWSPPQTGSVDLSVTLCSASSLALRTLNVTQYVRPARRALAALLLGRRPPLDDKQGKVRFSIGRDDDTTREVLDDMMPWMRAVWTRAPEALPLPFFASFVDVSAGTLPREARENVLDRSAPDDGLFDQESMERLGVCQLLRPWAAMVVPSGAGGATVLQKRKLASKDSRVKGIQEIRSAYRALSSERRLDLYNLLRFPKSNIAVCFDLLLWAAKERYPGIPGESLIHDSLALKALATEIWTGPTDSPSPDADPPHTPGCLAPDDFGREVAKCMGSPVIFTALREQLAIVGRVVDENGRPVAGSRIDGYYDLLHVQSEEGRKVYKAPVVSGQFDTLRSDEQDLPVLEILWAQRRQGNETDPECDFALVQREIAGETGWVLATERGSGAPQHHADLRAERWPAIATTDEEGRFVFDVDARVPHLVRCVSPGGEHFDGESGWITPPSSDVTITVERDTGMIRESEIVKGIGQFSGWGYDKDVPRFPATSQITQYGFRLHHLVPPDTDRVNDCSTFAATVLVEAWRPATWRFEADHKVFMLSSTPVDAYGPITVAENKRWVQPRVAGTSGSQPCPWTMVQGSQGTLSSGHVFIILDFHRPSGRLLTIESTGPKPPATEVDGLHGPGFRWLGPLANFQREIVVDDGRNLRVTVVDPNRDRAWQQVTHTWSSWWSERWAAGFMQTARLKVYDLQWGLCPLM